MAIADDISVAVGGNVRWTGASATYSVIELHRFLAGLTDDGSASGDDLVDISTIVPSDRTTDQIIQLNAPYNIDDTLAAQLYDGSIIQNDGDEIYDGIRVFAPQGTYVDIVQNGALLTNFWTTGLNADAPSGVSHRFLVKVRTAGADIDGRRLRGQTREFGSTYGEFNIGAGTSRGNNVISLSQATDLNNQTASGTVATWTDITNTEGYALIDANADGTDEAYYSEWNIAARSINDFYERMKYLTRRGTAETIYGLNGALFRGITHEITVDTPTGTFNAVEAVSWTGGTGQMLAIDSTTAAAKMWIQLLTGVAPTDGQTITGGTSSATVDVNVTVTERTLSFPFAGQSTGSAILGAYGVGIEAADLGASDKLFDLTNTQITPPNNVTFTVNGVVSGEDRVLVGPALGGALDESQFTLNGALTGAAVTAVVVNEAIPTDTPASATIRIQRANGVRTRHAYSAWDGPSKTFTITSHDFSTNNASNAAETYISYIDKLAASTAEAFSTIFLASRSLFIRVRDGGGTPIKPFEGTATLGSAGGSITAIRQPDV